MEAMTKRGVERRRARRRLVSEVRRLREELADTYRVAAANEALVAKELQAALGLDVLTETPDVQWLTARAAQTVKGLRALTDSLLPAARALLGSAEHYVVNTYTHGYGGEQMPAQKCPVCALERAIDAAPPVAPSPPLVLP